MWTSNISDNELDAWIAAALRQDRVVSGQQQRAWERLQRRAVQQAALPVTPAAPRQQRLPLNLWARFVGVLSLLLVEEGSYQRAHRQRSGIRCHDFDSIPLSFSTYLYYA